MKFALPIPVRLKTSYLISCDGYALPLVLIIMTLFFAVSTALLSAMTISLRESKAYLAYQKAVLAGKNAVEICKAELEADFHYAGTSGWQTLDDGSTCMIKVQTVSEAKKLITVKTILGDYPRYYEGEAELDPVNGCIVQWSLKLKRWNGSKE